MVCYKRYLKSGAYALIIAAFTATTAVAENYLIAAPILTSHFDQNGEGRSASLIRAAFAACGDTVTFQTFRWGEQWQAYENDTAIDGAAILRTGMKISGKISNPFVYNYNGVLYIKGKVPHPKSYDDLSGYRVIAFAGATKMFPELVPHIQSMGDFRQASAGYPPHRILKRNIADYFFTDGLMAAMDYMTAIDKAGGNYGTENWPRLSFAALAKPNAETVVFRDPSLTKHFNSCLNTARENGTLKKADEQWLLPFRDILQQSHFSN